MMKEQSGSAAMLAIFTVFVILSGVVALNTFESGYVRQINTLQQRIAVDTTKAVAAVVEAELNDALETAIAAAMFEAGKENRSKAFVENLLREYFNQRIDAGWSYSNFSISVLRSDENSLHVEWLPDGGLRAYGYLNALFEHVTGARAYGIKLDAEIAPRYGRMQYIAGLVYNQLQDTTKVQDIKLFENEINKEYAAECFSFKIYNRASFTVYELYGGRAITGENEG